MCLHNDLGTWAMTVNNPAHHIQTLPLFLQDLLLASGGTSVLRPGEEACASPGGGPEPPERGISGY